MVTKKAPREEVQVLDSVQFIRESIDAAVARTRAAQRRFATFCQEKVNEIFFSAAMAANAARIPLAKAAFEETGMGVLEDKVIKNHFASEFVYNKYRNEKTCGVIEKDETNGYFRIAEPIGVLAGIIPTTNPTSTAIFKALLALKTKNGIIFSPHPRAKKCTVMAAKLIHDAAVKAGAPEGIIGWIDNPTVEGSQYLMAHRDISMTLATGGPGMVRAAYSSGKPAIGVGSGNTPAVIDETCDIKMAVNSILLSKTFDNGLICASEQSVVVCDAVYDAVAAEFTRRGAVILDEQRREMLRNILLIDGHLNTDIVGRPAWKIAALAGFEVPETAKVLIGEAEVIGREEPLSFEKLSPVLGMYRAKDFDDAVEKAAALVEFAGMGHTSVLYTRPENRDRIKRYSRRLSTGRVLINMPSSQGAIGDVYNFRLEPSLTLGCGSWGGNSVSENVGIRHLINVKTVAERRENMLWFRIPSQVYFKPGCLGEALNELAGRKKAFLVTDRPLHDLGYSAKVIAHLERLGMDVEVFCDVKPDPDLTTVNRGLERMRAFNPDAVLALGGGSPIDAAKIMWLLYENPDVKFSHLAMRFMDIRKRVCRFPSLGKKAVMVAIPTTSGTGSEVTPFAVITDDAQGIKYPVADYELTPDMAIVDSDLVLSMPRSVTAASGIDAVTHALEAIAATTATEYTNGIAMEALRLLFTYLPASYRDGAANPEAREQVHNAATMAGMAFANAFLGLCHSMSHKLGSAFHVAHGVANGILITEVIRFNKTGSPRKQAAFPQYKYPDAKTRYARVADYLGLGGTDEDGKVENLIAAVADLRKSLDLPATISGAGVNEEEFMAKVDELSELAFDDQCTGNNPRYPLISEIRELYLRAFR
ncbi:MAG TPA: bifunctional acetaldehyde-CoA/alcohol dehydrogenase [Aminivibrio sp.]|uniref:bifunctional acetaldehyde-CoA/alcohol dehydrogenase n=1 Tax=Aminivibrio sp. TaxID=1872489 RepID=UPI002BF418FD|nr:bifunctional acetaldehyde-CoA/alcohol dehydrogenase [Aminivibrio sp.]HPF84953.1 bifunctional acetaldehyde-CoA/alcohol dehydrogenase [Aminivibrio sp.]